MVAADQRFMFRVDCDHCATCKWCHERRLKMDSFKLIDGPINHYFCDGLCSEKWVRYRHMVGIAHVIKMPPKIRREYLSGKTIDEFISNGMRV